MSAEGLLVVLSGPSGAGKDTVLKRLMEKAPGIRLSVSATTRLSTRNTAATVMVRRVSRLKNGRRKAAM